MKKSVALVVAFIALLGIVLVASFGTNPQNIIVPVYIETITLLDMDGGPLPTNPQGDKYLTLSFEPTFVDEEGVEYMRYAFSLEFNAGGEPPSKEDVIFTLGQAAVDPSDGLPVFSFEEILHKSIGLFRIFQCLVFGHCDISEYIGIFSLYAV